MGKIILLYFIMVRLILVVNIRLFVYGKWKIFCDVCNVYVSEIVVLSVIIVEWGWILNIFFVGKDFLKIKKF